MTFGVGVEGPSDYQFWHKVLHKHFRGCRFDVRNMKNRDKLIRETPKLLDRLEDFPELRVGERLTFDRGPHFDGFELVRFHDTLELGDRRAFRLQRHQHQLLFGACALKQRGGGNA